MTKTVGHNDRNIDHSQVEHIGAKILHKPNVVQSTLDIIWDEDYWRKRSCAFSCLLFSLNHFWLDLDTKEIPSYADKDFKFYDFKSGVEKSYKYFTKKSGWNNYAILQLAKEKWLNWKVYNKKLSSKDEFKDFMSSFPWDTTLIISIDFRWEIDDKIENWSHLVTFAGFYGEDHIIAKNPFSQNEDFKVYKIDEFVRSMKWNLIVLSDTQTDEFDAFSAIYFDEEKNWLVQNNEDFFTIETSNQKFVKIEKKDIFSSDLKIAIKKINPNVDKLDLQIAVEKLEQMREYYIPYL